MRLELTAPGLQDQFFNHWAKEDYVLRSETDLTQQVWNLIRNDIAKSKTV